VQQEQHFRIQYIVTIVYGQSTENVPHSLSICGPLHADNDK